MGTKLSVSDFVVRLNDAAPEVLAGLVRFAQNLEKEMTGGPILGRGVVDAPIDMTNVSQGAVVITSDGISDADLNAIGEKKADGVLLEKAGEIISAFIAGLMMGGGL